MKALLDTNIIIHRETSNIIDRSIGTLFRWLDKVKYIKCIHKVRIDELMKNSNQQRKETMAVKIDSYEKLVTTAAMDLEVSNAVLSIDQNINDKNDTILLNELYCKRVDIFITEDKKLHKKAKLLKIDDKVFTIDSFLEMVVSENPDLIDYKVLAVKQEYFGNINIKDNFFNTLREDYTGFDSWFNRKAEEKAYITYNDGKLLSFLYLKVENTDELYTNITPAFLPKKRLKIGTFKVESNGVRLGERFLKIIFDNAIQNKVEEIYVTIFEKRSDQVRLINLLEDWGFVKYGKNRDEGEIVFIKNMQKQFNIYDPQKSFPFISTSTNCFLIPIYPKYHTELLPDSFLSTESPTDFIENEPHRNALKKIYISRSIKCDIKTGDILIFYRTAPAGKNAYHHSVITTIGIVQNKIENIVDEKTFIQKARKRSIFTDSYLKEFWNHNLKYRPFLIYFLSVYSFEKGHRLNRKQLLDLGILTGEDNEIRGLKKITNKQFLTILQETKTNENYIIN